MPDSNPHISVLKNEVASNFSELPSGTLIDCTVGFGGHTEAILSINKNLKAICIDKDINALDFSKNRLSNRTARFIQGGFGEVIKELADEPIAGVIADLGVSSLQLDDRTRGFGFESEHLDMRMSGDSRLTAHEVVNSYSLEALERIFKEYGEIKEYKKAARLILEERKRKRFESAKELSALFEKNFRREKIHPATLAFQAIRIEVNNELGELESLLKTIGEICPKGAVVAIISFHSLEDRIVKSFFKSWENSCICPPEALKCACGNNHQKGKSLTKKPIEAAPAEVKNNPRSRSAKLRVFRFE